MKLKTKPTVIWIKVNESGDVTKVDENYQIKEDECKIKVKILSPSESHTLLEDSVEKEWDRNQRFEKPNFNKMRILQTQRSFLEWEGFKDEEDNPIACTDKSKELLYECNKEWVDKVHAGIARIEKDLLLLKEDGRKNSLSGQSGTSEKE